MSKRALFKSLMKEAGQIIENSNSAESAMKQISELLHKRVDTYDWVGFYIADPEVDRELYLGPYVGDKTDHTRIPFGKGICGQVAESHETFVVDDVNAQDNYLSCSLHVKSEIVVPIMKEGTFVAQLDIDSHTLAAMDQTDKEALEKICAKMASLF